MNQTAHILQRTFDNEGPGIHFFLLKVGLYWYVADRESRVLGQILITKYHLTQNAMNAEVEVTLLHREPQNTERLKLYINS